MQREPRRGSESPAYVRSLARGLEVIVALGDRSAGATLSEVAAMVELDRATARRLLLTLQQLGYVRSDGKHFALAPKILDLGYAYLSAMPVWEMALPDMRRMAEEAGENCGMGVFDEGDVVYIASAQSSKRKMAIQVSVGTRLPAYCTAMGHILLAGLSPLALSAYFRTLQPEKHTAETVTAVPRLRALIDEARGQGWAVSDRQFDAAIRSIAVPIHGGDNATIAAMNISVQASRIAAAELVGRYLPMLQASARRIEAALRRR